jgi:hypothetical protein
MKHTSGAHHYELIAANKRHGGVNKRDVTKFSMHRHFSEGLSHDRDVEIHPTLSLSDWRPPWLQFEVLTTSIESMGHEIWSKTAVRSRTPCLERFRNRTYLARDRCSACSKGQCSGAKVSAVQPGSSVAGAFHWSAGMNDDETSLQR